MRIRPLLDPLVSAPHCQEVNSLKLQSLDIINDLQIVLFVGTLHFFNNGMFEEFELHIGDNYHYRFSDPSSYK